MKKLTSLLLFITTIGIAQNDFKQGNALYHDGKYKEAIEAYKRVIDSQQESAELYFNLGNSYYKLNKVAPSIYNYEKALRLEPNNTDVKTNLGFAQKLTIDEIKEIPRVGQGKLVRNFTSIFNYNQWAWISVTLALLFLGSFIGYYFSTIALYKRIFFSGLFIQIVLLLVSISSAFFEKNYFENERPAIIFVEAVEVKGEPKKTSPATSVLHEGTKVYVLEDFEGWKKIQLINSAAGWIEKEAIKEVR